MTLTYGLVSTFPPTACGLATFTASLATELGSPSRHGDRCRIVRTVDAPEPPVPGVALDLESGSRTSRLRAVTTLDDTDVVIIQHEYGIFGGPDGDEIVTLIDALSVPVIAVLHTVLRDPTAHQKSVLEAVAAGADAVVTQTQTARHRLESGYEVDMSRVTVIPHGAHVTSVDPAAATDPGPPGTRRPTILTWGLIGPGKGIEWGIEALALMDDVRPRPRYLVLGKTHPKVLASHGEKYRNELMARAASLGVADQVEFDASYLDVDALQAIVHRASVVLLPYDSPDQITSGVLIEAVAAGKPVVSTPFPHAVELLGGGVGLLVAHRDPADIASALRRVLTEDGLSASLASASRRLAPGLAWRTVADAYRELAIDVAAHRSAAVA